VPEQRATAVAEKADYFPERPLAVPDSRAASDQRGLISILRFVFLKERQK
jgi:hypothetical protein